MIDETTSAVEEIPIVITVTSVTFHETQIQEYMEKL